MEKIKRGYELRMYLKDKNKGQSRAFIGCIYDNFDDALDEANKADEKSSDLYSLISIIEFDEDTRKTRLQLYEEELENPAEILEGIVDDH